MVSEVAWKAKVVVLAVATKEGAVASEEVAVAMDEAVVFSVAPLVLEVMVLRVSLKE